MESKAHTEEPRTPCPRNAAALPQGSLCSSALLCSSCLALWLGPFQVGFVWFWFCCAGPGLGDEGDVLHDTTMGTTAAARAWPARGGRAASGRGLVLAHVRQLRVPGCFSAPLCYQQVPWSRHGSLLPPRLDLEGIPKGAFP